MFCSRCGQPVDTSVKYCPNCGLDLTAITQGGAAGATQPLAVDDAAAVREALKAEYELEKELGRGGMAIVYKARDTALEREVAIKVLPFSLSFDADFVERFQREARNSAKLEHPNIIPIYRVGKSGRVIYYVMKFLRGQTLTKVIGARGALPVPEIKRLLIETGRALGYAHKHGIVHRDIKPDNIMFDELGQAIVTDFGIAKAQSGAKLTGTGMAIGTPHYMSPEQARAQPLDGKSDVYSLGVVGYQCLTGHVPFDGEDSFSIGYKHIMEELPTPPLETAEQRGLFAIIQRMMAKKAEERPTAEDTVGALEGSGGVAAAVSADVATRPTESLRPLAGVATIASQATTPLPRASGPMLRPPASAVATSAEAAKAARPKPRPARPPAEKPSRAPLVVVGLLVVVVAALAAYYFLVLRQAPPSLASADTTHVAAPAPRDTAKAPAVRPESAGAPAATPQGAATQPGAQPAGTPPATTPAATTQPAAQPPVQPAAPHPARGRERPPRKEPPGGVKAPPAVAHATPAAPGAAPDCEAGPVSIQNPNRACWDTKPVAQFTPQVGVPPACASSPPALTLNVHVSRTGDVLQAVPASRPSPCRAFQEQVLAQALDFHFTPAHKGGAAVGAWVQVVIRPVRP